MGSAGEHDLGREAGGVGTEAGYRESLVVVDGESRLTASAAEDRLQDFLPGDFVEFFFFDGEEIKAMAEMAEGRKAVDFDKVLGTSFISELADEGNTYGSGPAKEVGESESARAACDRRRRHWEGQRRQRLRLKTRSLRREEELVDFRREQNQLLTRRENLRTGASSAEREELELRRGGVGRTAWRSHRGDLQDCPKRGADGRESKSCRGRLSLSSMRD